MLILQKSWKILKRDIYNYNKYGDNLARKKRRRFFLKFSIVFSAILVLGGLVVYLFFFSRFLQITEQSIEGLSVLKSEDIYKISESVINQTAFGVSALKPQRNIFFFSSEFVANKIRSEFPVVETVSIKKDYPHKIIIQIKERDPIGVWCFSETSSVSFDKVQDKSLTTSTCRYFDQYGILWGQALKSSGSLFLNIEDARNIEPIPKTIESYFHASFKRVTSDFERLNIAIRKISIPNDSIHDFYVYTDRGYYAIFNADQEINKQIESLEIFLFNKDNNFNAEYVDARIPGRIYYK